MLTVCEKALECQESLWDPPLSTTLPRPESVAGGGGKACHIGHYVMPEARWIKVVNLSNTCTVNSRGERRFCVTERREVILFGLHYHFYFHCLMTGRD